MKIPEPTQLPSGRWRVQYQADGARRSRTFDTEGEARVFASSWKAGIADAAPVSELSVGKAMDRYIESKDGVLSPATVAAYKRIRKNCLQELMGLKLRALTQERVQRAVNAMTKEGKSPKTVRNAHGLLTATLAEYRPGLVLRTTLPQRIRYEAAVPSVEDVRAILAALPGTEVELPVTLAVWLGLRMSEVLGLRWGDVDLKNKVVHIRRAKVDEGVKTTKTYGSQRDLPLPAHIIGLLGEPGNKDAEVVRMTRRRILTVFHRLCEEAGVQPYRFHDLRHINASVMLAQGIPDKYAMERMGHATNNMLKTVYQHTMDAQAQAYAAQLDAFFESLLPDKTHTPVHTDFDSSLDSSQL